MPLDIRLEDYHAQVEAQAKAEVEQVDNVFNEISYKRFLSRSKGWRNGRRRLRKGKEVHLVGKSGFYHLWHNFQFDVHATEIIGEHADGEMLKERIIELWGF